MGRRKRTKLYVSLTYAPTFIVLENKRNWRYDFGITASGSIAGALAVAVILGLLGRIQPPIVEYARQRVSAQRQVQEKPSSTQVSNPLLIGRAYSVPLLENLTTTATISAIATPMLTSEVVAPLTFPITGDAVQAIVHRNSLDNPLELPVASVPNLLVGSGSALLPVVQSNILSSKTN